MDDDPSLEMGCEGLGGVSVVAKTLHNEKGSRMSVKVTVKKPLS